MRKIYKEYFHIPKQGEGNVREKVFFARLTVSIACIILCMAAMGFNAYAYFTSTITATANVLRAATYSTPVTTIALIPEGKGSATADTQIPYKYTLSPGQYDFTLTKGGDATTGYCRIDVGEGDSKKSFYTEQIGVINANGEEVLSRIVRITVEKETVVQFVGCWGTYTGSNGTPIVQGETMIMMGSDGQVACIDWATAEPETNQPKQEEPPVNNPSEQTAPTVADEVEQEDATVDNAADDEVDDEIDDVGEEPIENPDNLGDTAGDTNPP